MLNKFGTQLKISSAGTTLEDIVVDKPVTKIIEPKRGDFLYFRARSITAGDQGPEQDIPNPNGNGDYFPRKELETSYQTFVGRNLFLNHDSDHPIKSIGKIIDAYPVEDPETGEYYIECLSKIDRKLHPEIARKVETGEHDKVSMGCSVEQSMCSICGHIIHTDEDTKCEHLSPTGLLKPYQAEVDLPEYKIKKGQRINAFSINTGITFNELSIVNVPADSRAVIKTVIANLRHQFKTTSLTKEESLELLSQIDKLLGQLDDKTREEIKAEFCACTIVKEDSKMAVDMNKDKNLVTTSNEVSPDSQKTSPEENEVREVLKRLNAYDYLRLQRHYNGKTTEVISPVVTKEPVLVTAELKVEDTKTEDDTFLQKVIEKVKTTFASKMFAQTIKRAVEEVKTDNTTPEVPETKSSIYAEFKKEAELEKSTWTIFDEGKPVITASLSQIWGEALEFDPEWTINDVNEILGGKTYATALVDRYTNAKKENGVEKFAELLGIAYTSMDVKDSKVETPTKSDFVKPGEETKADKEADKTQEALKKNDETATGEHLESSKPEGEQKKTASEYTDFTKKYLTDNPGSSIGDAAKAWSASKSKKETLAVDKKEEPKMEEKVAKMCTTCNCPMEQCTCSSKDMEMQKEQTMDTKASAFDKVDKVILGDGFEAHKDPETTEICIYDKDGKEVKRLPDGFGEDVVTVMKLLRSVMGLKDEEKEEMPKMEEPKMEEMPKETPKMEELPKPDMSMEKETTYAAKEAELKKKADELAKKEAELKVVEAKLNASRFSSIVNSKTEKCKTIVESMLDRGLLDIADEDIEAAIAEGKTVLDARHLAFQKSINNQIKALLGMDELSLKAFEESISRIKRVASKKLTRPIHIEYETEDADKEIKGIFSSMGTLKNT